MARQPRSRQAQSSAIPHPLRMRQPREYGYLLAVPAASAGVCERGLREHRHAHDVWCQPSQCSPHHNRPGRYTYASTCMLACITCGKVFSTIFECCRHPKPTRPPPQFPLNDTSTCSSEVNYPGVECLARLAVRVQLAVCAEAISAQY